jgi:hypothetical protein
MFLVARGGPELAAWASANTDGAECDGRPLGSEWWLYQVHTHEIFSPADLAAGMAAETAAPALACYVVDSDFAEVSCDSPAGVRHTFLLDPEAALGSFMPWDPPPPEPPAVEDTVAELMRWSAESGLSAVPEAIAAAIPIRPGPFGEGVDGLLSALGVPGVACEAAVGPQS